MTHIDLVEHIVPGIIRHWTDCELIAEKQTQYQNVKIVRTCQGVTLFCDNERQSSEATHTLFHEGLIYPALFYCPKPKNALVLGSSEGVVPKVLSEFTENVLHVDIDEDCVRLCAQHLPYGYSPEEVEDRIETGKLTFLDGYDFIQRSHGLWDIICMDLPDSELGGQSPCDRLYTETFLRKIKSRLTENGVFITQAGSFLYGQNDKLKELWPRMKNVFPYPKYFDQPEQGWAWLLGMNHDFRSMNPSTGPESVTFSWPAFKNSQLPSFLS